MVLQCFLVLPRQKTRISLQNACDVLVFTFLHNYIYSAFACLDLLDQLQDQTRPTDGGGRPGSDWRDKYEDVTSSYDPYDYGSDEYNNVGSLEEKEGQSSKMGLLTLLVLFIANGRRIAVGSCLIFYI